MVSFSFCLRWLYTYYYRGVLYTITITKNNDDQALLDVYNILQIVSYHVLLEHKT